MEQNDFIYISKGVYSKEYCESLIEFFNWSASAGVAYNREQSNHIISDSAAFIEPDTASTIGLTMEQMARYQKGFTDIFWAEYAKYCSKYSVLWDCGSHTLLTLKIQKTKIGEGYHAWHFEQDCLGRSSRLAAWMVYLNDVEEGGETEFLYQHKRVTPTLGTLLIWPAGFTHVHRGNPPLSNDKYILTGWLEYIK